MKHLIRAFLSALSVLALASVACAQTTLAVNPTTLALPVCPAGQFLTSNGTTLTCAAPPAAGSTVTVAAGTGVAVAGGPAYTISVAYPVATKTTSYAVVATDGAKTLVYNSTTPGTFSFPASSAASFGNGWGLCVINRGTGALTLTTTTSVFYGGPSTLNRDQSECVQADDGGNWALFTGVAAVVSNPNVFQ